MSIKRFKKLICVALVTVVSAVFVVTLFFAVPKTVTVPETSGTVTVNDFANLPDGSFLPVNTSYEIGADITAVRISDLTECGAITTVNYVPDKFVKARSLDDGIQIVDLTKPFEFAKKGTLIFAVMNLDPLDEQFDITYEAMSDYKIGDYWHFDFFLPKIFCAANVYCNYDLISQHGEIEDYDFMDYSLATGDNRRTEEFIPETANDYINLRFYTKRESMSNFFSTALITVHYQSSGGAYSGITDLPLIGTEKALKRVNDTSQNLLIAFAILAAVVFSVLVVLAVVERSKKFLSAIVWIFGIMIMLFGRYILRGVSSAPLLWTALSLSTPFVIFCGALFAVGRNFGKIPAKFIFPILSAVGALFAFLCPFIPFDAATAMRVVCVVIRAIGAVALTAFIGLELFDKKRDDILRICCTAIITVATVSSLFLPQIFPAQINPIFWLCAATTVITFFSVILFIMDMKKSNVYLTENLHREVERQVTDIKAVIAERDKLLTFVSHDMKKPLASAVMLCDTAIRREKDDEQVKTIGIIKQDAERVISNLSEIAAYAKLNYLAETSQVVDMSELCALIYKYHRFDCDANGIILKNTVASSIKAFVKPKGIENVVSNIIINAIEHANCKTITLSVASNKNKTVLSIADDGKGIDKNLDVFSPYLSENNTETGGVGLYICKNIIDSMNGELSYESSRLGTVFHISLLKA